MYLLAVAVFLEFLLPSGVEAECSFLGRPSKTFNNSKTCCHPGVEVDCIECVRLDVGNLPMILTIPHGGNFRPDSILDRTGGCYNASSNSCIYLHTCPEGTTYDATECETITSSDYRSDEIAILVHDHILNKTQKCPTVIMSLLYRGKLDPNRNDSLTNFKATFNETVPLYVYENYHGTIREQISALNGTDGLALGFHGYDDDDVNWTILGYSISKSALNSSNSSVLDDMKDDSSISKLVDRMSSNTIRNETLSSLLYGDFSLGAFLEREMVMNENLTAVPSPNNKKPYDKKYFGATKSQLTNDHDIDTAQVEIHADFRNHAGGKTVRQEWQNEYVRALGDAIIYFFREFYDACILSPCQNNGTCNKSVRDYSCACQDGYTGKDCETVICNNAVDVEHATRDTNKSTYSRLDETVTYTCNSGYQISAGNSTITCIGPHEWSGTSPTCTAVICNNAVDVEHATRDTNKSTYSLDETVTYTCNSGYQISAGNSTITCIGPHEWSGTSPTCTEIPDPCEPNPCVHGQCSAKDGNTDFDCRCEHRYVGKKCDEPLKRVTSCIKSPRIGQSLYCLLRGRFKYGNECCKDANECDHDPCSFEENCDCVNKRKDYKCVSQFGALCPIFAVLVRLVIKHGKFVLGMAALSGVVFAVLFKEKYATLIASFDMLLSPHEILQVHQCNISKIINDYGVDSTMANRLHRIAEILKQRKPNGYTPVSPTRNRVSGTFRLDGGSIFVEIADTKVIAAVSSVFIDFEIVKLGPGSIDVSGVGTMSKYTDPTPLIEQKLESEGITDVIVKEATSLSNYCDIGEYRDEVTGYCTKCSVGTFSNNIYGLQCVVCASGYYQNEVGQSQCKPCDPGYFTADMGSESCAACTEGLYSLAGASSCTYCDPGSVAEEGQASCTACEPGTAPNNEISQCENCLAGNYSETGLECIPCGPGSVSIEAQSDCTPCEPGTEPNEEKSLCVDCSAGTYSVTGLECIPCGPGSVSIEAQSDCTPCEPGTEPNEEKSLCVDCSAGTYSVTGLECIPCGPGSVSIGEQSDCTPCEPGTEPNEEKSLCVDCSAGTYSVTGSECVQCEPGSYSGERSVSCLLCNNGSVPNPDQSRCDMCEPGSYAISGFKSCKHCEDGTYSSTDGQSQCIPCNAGYIPNSNNTGCDPCPAGNWSYSGDHACRPCEGGSISSAGQPNCTDCNAGTAPNDEKSECLDCPPGFNSSSGDEECSQCPPDMWSSEGSALCSWCEACEMTLADQSGCVPNIACGRKTKQKSGSGSSNSDMHADVSSKAVDDDFYSSCSQTKKTRNPWWRVKLDGWYTIKYVVIQTSKDPSVEKLHDIKIYINGKKNLCGEYPGPAETGERINITCDSPIVGKNVRVEMTTPRRRKERLILCECFVIGDPANKPEKSSSSSDQSESEESKSDNASKPKKNNSSNGGAGSESEENKSSKASKPKKNNSSNDSSESESEENKSGKETKKKQKAKKNGRKGRRG